MKKVIYLSATLFLFSSCFFGKTVSNTTPTGQTTSATGEYVGEVYVEEPQQVEYASWLNKDEAKELNAIFEAYRNDFDFTNKNVIFFMGSTGKLRSNKEHYFRMQKKYDNTSYYNRDNGYLYIFDEDQKAAVGGYDAAIVFWTKNQLSTEEVMERIMQEPPVE